VIEIDPDVFIYDDEEDFSKETFVVTGIFSDQIVVDALSSAGDRFMRVDETGVEHPDLVSTEAAGMAGLYTPNYVSEPEVTDAGVQMYLDCKGAIPDPTAHKLRQILKETLERVDVDAHVSAVD
jgi:hypothetical protein